VASPPDPKSGPEEELLLGQVVSPEPQERFPVLPRLPPVPVSHPEQVQAKVPEPVLEARPVLLGFEQQRQLGQSVARESYLEEAIRRVLERAEGNCFAELKQE
jgi:hypothetical protein